MKHDVAPVLGLVELRLGPREADAAAASSASSRRSRPGRSAATPGSPATMFGSSAGVAQRRRAARAAPVEPDVDADREPGQHEQAEQQPGDLKRDDGTASHLDGRSAQERRERAAASRPRSRARRAARRPRRAAGTSPLRSSAAASANRSRSRASLVSTRSWRPVSGSTSRSSPTSASSCSRGSRISIASVGWRPATRRSAALPVERAAEVGDDDDERALHGEPVERARAPRRGRPRPPGRRAAPPSVSSRPRRPWRGRRQRGSPAPKATTPSRLPRRVAAWPTASATPSATSALRRSAVPNAIEAEASKTSQVTSTRSASSTRTCVCAGARGDVPVDPAHVVARLVGAHLVELGADPGEGGAVVAGEQPVDAAADRELERLEALGA